MLQKYGLVEESKEFSNSLLQRGAELLKENKELRRLPIGCLIRRTDGYVYYGESGNAGEDEGETG